MTPIAYADKSASAPLGSAERTWRASDANEVKASVNLIISEFDENVRTALATAIEAGTNVTLSIDEETGVLTISASGGAGGGDLSASDIDTLAELNAILTDATLIDAGALSPVATSGDYDDLSGKPTLGTAAATDSTAYATAAHAASTSNPHSVTKTQVGLGNVDNTSDADKPVSTATQDALDLKADSATLAETIMDTVASFLVAGANVILTHDDGANTLTIASSGGGGGGLSDGDYGDVTVGGSGTTITIDAGSVTLAKMANIATASFVGRATAGTGVPEALSASDARGILNVADGATANATNSELRDRATHTGTQAASTISDFSSAVAATAAVTANTAKVTNADHTGDVTGSAALTIANDAVTNAKMANMAASTFKARATASTGDPEDITPSQAKTLLELAKADVGLGNVDNTSNATERAASATLTNKTIASADNTLAVSTYSYAANQTLTSAQCYGSVVYVTAAATIALPAIAPGMSVTVIAIGDVEVSIDPDAADSIVLDGLALDDGDKITNGSTAGDVAVLTYYGAGGWHAATNAWTDGGAA